MNMGDYTSMGFQNILWFLKAFMFFGALQFSKCQWPGTCLPVYFNGREIQNFFGNTCLRFGGFTEMGNI